MKCNQLPERPLAQSYERSEAGFQLLLDPGSISVRGVAQRNLDEWVNETMYSSQSHIWQLCTTSTGNTAKRLFITLALS